MLKNDTLALFGGKPLIKKKIYPNMASISNEEIKAAKKVLKENRLSVFTSEKVNEFEKAFSKYQKVENSVAVNSGTAALHLALASSGIDVNDEVIVPVYTYAATALSVLYQNAKPIFSDINPDTYNIDPHDVDRLITKNTKAIIVAHLFGQPVTMDPILDIAKEHNLIVIEDCAHALGAEYKGKKVGSIGDIGCFSFQESKNITTGGEGGMLITKSYDIAEKARIIAHEGEIYNDGKSSARSGPGPLPFSYKQIGYNYRMNAVQAAIGLEQLKRLDELNNLRISKAKLYFDALKDFDELDLPASLIDVKHVYNNFVIKVKKDFAPRDMFLMALNAEGVPATTYYPYLLSSQPVFSKNEHREYLNATNALAEQIVLPIYPYLKEKDQQIIVQSIKKVITGLKED